MVLYLFAPTAGVWRLEVFIVLSWKVELTIVYEVTLYSD
jgi:hypothetical protein